MSQVTEWLSLPVLLLLTAFWRANGQQIDNGDERVVVATVIVNAGSNKYSHVNIETDY